MTVGRSTSPTHQRGQLAEETACRYLQEQGFQLIQANYHCKLGEIDLIMQRHTLLIFVEVRMRRHNAMMDAAMTVTRPKQRKLIRTAQWFLQEFPHYAELDCRFDVMAFNPAKGELTGAPDWIQGAFYAG